MAESLWTLEYGDNVSPLIYTSQAPAHLGRCRDGGKEVRCGGSSVGDL